MPLSLGSNWFTVKSEDEAGNVARQRIEIVRVASRAAIDLTVTPTTVDLADLPATIDITATITDDEGLADDGAPVTFSVSPPNAATVTYYTEATRGRARWPSFVVNDDGQASGQWLVTALATLPSGTELRDDASFKVH